MTLITDFNAPELDIYARYTEAQLLNKDHPEDGMFIAESPKVIERALGAGYEPVSFLVEINDREAAGLDLLAEYEDKIPIYTAKMEVLEHITGYKLTRGMLCAMKRRPLPSVEKVCEGASRIAVLEDVMNPTNIGAIFRSAAALGMDAILLTGGCSDPFYRRAARVSMGTVFQIPWTFAEEGSEALIRRLKSEGFAVASMALVEDSIGIDDPRLKKDKKLAIFLGTEGDGLKNKTIELSDYTLKIPMAHGVDSLNVAAASAVVFWELGKSWAEEVRTAASSERP